MRLLPDFHLMGRREKELLKLFDNQMDLVEKAVGALKPLVTAAERGDWQIAESNSAMISKYGSLSRDTHRRSIMRLCEGTFFAGLREDFLNLLERIDKIGVQAKDAARIITESRLAANDFGYLHPSPEASIDIYLDRVALTVRALEEAIHSLESSSKEAIQGALQVEKLEEEADETKFRLLRHLYDHRTDLDLFAFLHLKDFILKLDDIADAAEDSSDVIIEIVAKGAG